MVRKYAAVKKSGAMVKKSYRRYYNPVIKNNLCYTTIRESTEYVADAGGNLSVKLSCTGYLNTTQNIQFRQCFREIKVLKYSVTFFPSGNIMADTTGNKNVYGCLFMAPYHGIAPSTLSTTSIQSIPECRMFTFNDSRPKKCTWYRKKFDGAEDQFVESALAHPEQLGGIALWSNGPTSAAGTFIGEFVQEWQVVYRGVISQ